LRTIAPLPEGSTLHIRFTLPHDANAIELTAEVVRTLSMETHFEMEPGMGLRFVGIPETTRLRLRNFVQWEMMGDLDWKSTI
jgi:c-di-GMP-binding flagellar brake protein YcgR